jgi:hypothetical protein
MHTKFLVSKHHGKRPLGRIRYRWKENIKTNLREIDCAYVNWTEIVQ